MRRNLLIGLFNIAFIIIVFGSYVIVAQSVITGEWRSDNRSEKQNKDGKIHLSFERRTQNGRSQNGSSFSYADLQGLSREQTQNGKVSFRLVREAGTLDCEGSFVNGKGSGTFRFTPNSGYVASMGSRGFDFEKFASKSDDGIDGRLLSAALLNVTTALADDLKSVELGPLDIDDLFKAAIFKVDSKFMAEMKASDFPDLKMEDLVKARIFKIDAEFVRKIREMGFGTENFEDLVKFSIFRVTPEFLNELKAAGFDKLSSEDIVKCRIFKIDGDFIRQAKTEEPDVSIEDLVQMKIGVRRKH